MQASHFQGFMRERVVAIMKSFAGTDPDLEAAVVAQNQAGHNRIIEGGMLFELFPSVRDAVRAVAESIASRKEPHDQRRQAEKLAAGLLVAASRTSGSEPGAQLSFDLFANRRRRGQRQGEELAEFVTSLRQADDRDNPIVVTAQLVHDPVAGAGATALLETWLRPDDDLSRYAIGAFVREAGRATSERAPMLERIEQFLLHPATQGEPVLRQPVEQALLEQVILDGRVNRYAIDLMCREKFGLERVALRALAGLTAPGDAMFMLDRVTARGADAIGVLTGAVGFHREGDEALTEQVQAAAIARATDLLLKFADTASVEAFARQLHERFQDMPTVRQAAYGACGRLGSFVSIRPLRDRQPKETVAAAKAAILDAVSALRDKLARSKPDPAKPEDIKAWLGHTATLADHTLLASAAGYLRPPHSDHGVRRAALNAVAGMGGPEALDVVKRFIENTAPEGETLAAARGARMRLEQRNDAGLFETLGGYFDADAEVLDPALDYEALLGTHLMASTNRGLTKAQKLRNDGHWDEFITQINGVTEALVRRIFRTRYAAMGLDQQKGEKLGGGNAYAPMLAMTEFKNAFGKLQAHANTIQSFRRDSPTAHAMNKDGTAKSEASPDDAEYVRDEFVPAFTEAVRALR